MNVDLCIWTKNGAETLAPVLRRVEEVIPHEEIRKKIAVDDSSTDSSVELLKKFNWEVYPNREGFINSGTKEALKHVETEFFVSIEQDVLLSRKWWGAIPHYMNDERVAVAQGIRLSTNETERAVETLKIRKLKRLSLEEKSKMYFSIDNNIYRTVVIKNLGFVDDPVAMAPFYVKVISNGFRWITDISVVSTHLRGNLFDVISHTTRFYSLTEQHTDLDDMSILRFLGGIVASPLKGFKMSIETKEPKVQIFYPLKRLLLTRVYHRNKRTS